MTLTPTGSMHTAQANPAIGERGLIDIYLPPGVERPPFVLGVHGGGWTHGDRTSYAWVAARLIPHGLAFVSCSYRVVSQSPFPAAYDDLVQLGTWLREHAQEHGLSERCALLGSSAGGHLVCLLGSRGTREQGCRMIPIRAVVSFCPVTDMVLQYEHDHAVGRELTRPFLGGDPAQVPAAYVASSPLEHVHRDMPPLWLAHGDVDQVVRIEHSHRLVQRMRAMGHDPEFHVAAGCEHTMGEPGTEPKTLLREPAVLAFLRRHLL